MNGETTTPQEIVHQLEKLRLLLDETRKAEFEVKYAQHALQTSEIRCRRLFEAAQVMAAIVEERDPYKTGHQRRVADLALSIAEEMNLSNHQAQGLRLAGEIHDIGKISIPGEILGKRARLTEAEYQIVKTHVLVGYDILKDMPFPWPIGRIVLEHHEKMDGSGYPNGLTGDRLLLESRILAVADVVDALATPRPYRPALSIQAALYDVRGNSGILYDPDVVAVCSRLFDERGYKMLED